VATSPFKLLGNMFGGGEEVNLIDFEPGSATLDAAATEKLNSIRRALFERPQLELEVPASYAPDADYAVLAKQQLETRLTTLARSRKQPVDPALPAARQELLLALYKQDKPGAALPPGALALQSLREKDRDPAAIETANAELESALRPSIDSLDTALGALAQQRARAIQDVLLTSGEVAPGRVFMLSSSAAPASDGKVRIALNLK
jgi:hypothetical protein